MTKVPCETLIFRRPQKDRNMPGTHQEHTGNINERLRLLMGGCWHPVFQSLSQEHARNLNTHFDYNRPRYKAPQHAPAFSSWPTWDRVCRQVFGGDLFEINGYQQFLQLGCIWASEKFSVIGEWKNTTFCILFPLDNRTSRLLRKQRNYMYDLNIRCAV